MNKFNNMLARKATLRFGTMWVCYMFFFYGLLPLLPILKPYQDMIMYWSTWVQLWALPLIMVGQNVLNKSNEEHNQKVLESIAQAIERIEHIVQLIEAKEEKIDTEIEALTEKVNEIDAQEADTN